MLEAAPVIVIAVILLLALGFGPTLADRIFQREQAGEPSSRQIDLGASND